MLMPIASSVASVNTATRARSPLPLTHASAAVSERRLIRERDRVEIGKPNYDVDSLVGRVSKNTPDVEAFAQLTRYIRGEGFNDLDWLGRDDGLMVIIRTLIMAPIAVMGVPTSACMAEMRLRLCVLACKAYYEGSNGYVEKTVAQNLYTSLHAWAKVARKRFVGNGALAFKMVEARNIVSRMDATQTRWERARHKMFDVLLFGVILASTFLPILAPTRTTYLPVLGAATAGNVVGLALIRDLFTPRPRPRPWYLHYKKLEDELLALERQGGGTVEARTRFAQELRNELWHPPKKVLLHARTYAFQLGCLDLMHRLVAISDEPEVLNMCVKSTASYLLFGESKKGGALIRQMAVSVALDIAQKAPSLFNGDPLLGNIMARTRGTPHCQAALQLRSARDALYKVGMPHDLDSLPAVNEGIWGTRLPR